MRIYENVTRAIIEEMERGAVPWVRPWKTDGRNTAASCRQTPSPAGVQRHQRADPLGERRQQRLSHPMRG